MLFKNSIPISMFFCGKSESGEDEYSIGIHLEKMRTECLKRTPNIRLLQDCMARTRNERADYVKHHSTKEILSRYPALKIPSIVSRLQSNEHLHIWTFLLIFFSLTACIRVWKHTWCKHWKEHSEKSCPGGTESY